MEEQHTDGHFNNGLNVEDLYLVIREVLIRDQTAVDPQESFWVLGLGEDRELLFVDWVDLSSSYSERERALLVYNLGLQKKASRIIFCHNRLQTPLAVGEKDRMLADQLLQLSKILSLKVADYLLFSVDGFISFQKTGILEELSQNSQHIPSRELVQHLQVEAAKFTQRKVKEAKELATRIEKLRIAKALKYGGVEAEAIMLATELRPEEFERL